MVAVLPREREAHSRRPSRVHTVASARAVASLQRAAISRGTLHEASLGCRYRYLQRSRGLVCDHGTFRKTAQARLSARTDDKNENMLYNCTVCVVSTALVSARGVKTRLELHVALGCRMRASKRALDARLSSTSSDPSNAFVCADHCSPDHQPALATQDHATVDAHMVFHTVSVYVTCPPRSDR